MYINIYSAHFKLKKTTRNESIQFYTGCCTWKSKISYNMDMVNVFFSHVRKLYRQKGTATKVYIHK